MSDTPRTDAWKRVNDPIEDLHIFARQLERELNAANQISKKYEDRYFECLERIKRLEEAGDVIKASLQRSLNPNEQGECKWLAELPMTDAEFAVFTTAFKAKEAKP